MQRAAPQDILLNSALISKAAENGGEYYEYFSANMDTENRFRQPGSRGQQVRQGARRQMESLLYVKISGEKAVIINAVISPVNATVTTLRSQLLMISGIMLVMAIALAVFIARRVSRPIEAINHAARSLASGNYNTRFSGRGYQEIEELSETLNTTADELGKTEALRRELLANVSHDLLTPLTLIYSYAEMMCDFPAEITKEQAVVIMDETKRLTSLVNDVMDISKLEAGMESLNVSRFNLTKSIGETIDVLRKLLKNQNYRIDFNHDDDVYICADETKINRAFYNLLVNAVNYSGENRGISAAQTLSGASVRISVTDSGDGICEAELPFIWDRYYRGGKTHRRAVTGTGLGLSIVKKIIETHGGKYGVSSREGKGSTFWFELEKQDEKI
jgi:signal transduction histidine kinase